MITLTLFDVASISGLQPIGETLNPGLKNKTKRSFTFDHPSFTAHIKDHHDQTE